MSHNLPTGGFHETDFTERNKSNSLKTTLRTQGNIKFGYLSECDSENLSKIHEKTETFPNVSTEINM